MTRWLVERSLLGLCLLGVGGCTFTDGAPWGRLEPHVEASLDVEARQQGERFSTARGFALELEVIDLDLSALEIQMAATGGAAGFDPASPPSGYSLCHNGHCHADDGRLVPYEEIAAELATGGGGAPAVVVPIDQRLALLDGAPHAAALSCEAGCDLPRGELAAARLRVAALSVRGRAFDPQEGSPRLPAAGAPFQATIPLDLTFTAGIAGAVDDDSALIVAPSGRFMLSERLFDGVDWDAVAGEGGELSGSASFVTAVREVIEARSVWLVAVERRDP